MIYGRRIWETRSFLKISWTLASGKICFVRISREMSAKDQKTEKEKKKTSRINAEKKNRIKLFLDKMIVKFYMNVCGWRVVEWIYMWLTMFFFLYLLKIFHRVIMGRKSFSGYEKHCICIFSFFHFFESSFNKIQYRIITVTEYVKRFIIDKYAKH